MSPISSKVHFESNCVRSGSVKPKAATLKPSRTPMHHSSSSEQLMKLPNTGIVELTENVKEALSVMIFVI